MSIADLMRRMADAGAPIDAIIVAVEALEAEQSRVAAAKEKVAQRKRDQRARERDMAVTVTGQSQDMAVTPPLSSPSPFLPPDPQQTPTPAYPREITPHARKADEFPKPEWADPQVWADFMANRKAKKARNTVTAYRGFLSDIEKFTSDDWPPGRLLEHAAAKGWAGIYEPDKDDRNGTRTRQSTVQQAADILRGPRPDPAIDMWKQAQADLAAEREDPGFDSETRPPLPSYLTN